MVDIDRTQLLRYENFLKTWRVHPSLTRLLPTLIFDYKPDISLTINASGDCFTDGKHIQLSLLPYFFNKKYSEEIWYMAMRAAEAHECQHINSSDMSAMKTIGEWYGKYLKDNFSLPEWVGGKIAPSFLNIFEDGRIEQIIVTHHAGLKMPLLMLNTEMFRGSKLKQPEGGEAEYTDFQNQVLCYAKLGRSIRGFGKLKGTEFYKNFNAIRHNIDNAVGGLTCADCIAEVKVALITIAPYIAKLLRASAELTEMLKALEPMMSGGSSERELNDGNPSDGIRKQPRKKAGGAPQPDNESDESDSGNGSGSGNKPETDGEAKDNSGGKSGEGSGDKAETDDNAEGGSGEASGGKPEGEPGGGSGNKNKEDADGNSESDAGSDNKGSQSQKSDSNKSASTDSSAGPVTGNDHTDSNGGSSFSGGDDCDELPEELDESELPYSEKELFDALNSVANTPGPAEKSNHNELSDKDKDALAKQYENDVYTTFDEEFETVVPLPLPAATASRAKALHRQLTQIMRTKAAEQRNQRKGVLDNRALWKVGTNSPDVFYKRGRPNTSDCAVFELIDNSGSMGGMKYKVARLVGGALEVALEGLAALKVSLFCTMSSVRHFTVKDFGDTAPSGKSVTFGSLAHSNIAANGGNKDGYSIRVATKELLKRQEKHKILIVLSDGVPTDYANGINQGMADVRDAVKEARRKGIIVVAFLIGDDGFVKSNRQHYIDMYGRSVIACSPDQMLTEFEKLFTQLIKQS